MSKVVIFIGPDVNGVDNPRNVVGADFKVTEVYYKAQGSAADIPNPGDVIIPRVELRLTEDMNAGAYPGDRRFSFLKSTKAVAIDGNGPSNGYKIEVREEMGFIIKAGEYVSPTITGLPFSPILHGLWLTGEYL